MNGEGLKESKEFSPRVEALKTKVAALYESKKSQRAEWSDWLYTNHVFLVADKSAEVARRFGANAELAYVAGMLHDIADAVMSRFDPRHEEESISIARGYLHEAGFTDEEIHTIVDDAIKYHGCHDGVAPKTPEGRAMATADALVHLQSDFYDHAISSAVGKDPADKVREWGLKKIDRDFNSKILFEAVKGEARPDYERWKTRFESLT